MLWPMDRSPVELVLACHAPANAGRMLAEHHAMLRRLDGERTQVEELAVERAQRQAIGLDVWPADVMPLDMRRFQTDRR